jgi:hypothetical protein
VLTFTALENTSTVFVRAWARLNTIDPDTLYRLVGPYSDAGQRQWLHPDELLAKF